MNIPILGTSLFFNTKASVGGLYFDAELSEDHTYEADITDHPIEVGANITDNAVIQPTIVNLNVAVSSVYSISTLLSFSGSNRPQDAVQKLRQLQANRTPVNLICRLASYPNMLIKSIRAKQDTATANSAMIMITFKEAIIVDSSAGSIYNNPVDKQYSAPQNEGTKQARQT